MLTSIIIGAIAVQQIYFHIPEFRTSGKSPLHCRSCSCHSLDHQLASLLADRIDRTGHPFFLSMKNREYHAPCFKTDMSRLSFRIPSGICVKVLFNGIPCGREYPEIINITDHRTVVIDRIIALDQIQKGSDH